MFFQGSAIFIPDKSQICLIMRSIDDESYFGHKIEKDSEKVTTHIHKAFGLMTSLGENRNRVQFITNIDVHLDYVPQTLINWGLTNLSGSIIDMVKNNSEKLPEKYV